MGNCGSNKGEAKKETVEEFSFKNVGVFEVDEFFGRVKSLLDSFKECTGPLDEASDDFYDTTKFYEVPGASKYFPHHSDLIFL